MAAESMPAESPPAESPRRHSIMLRILAGSFVVALGAIAATAWLSVQGTTGAIRQEQGETAASTALSYDTLLGYAATHADWSGVKKTLTHLHDTTGLTLELTTSDRSPIATTASGDGAAQGGKLTAVVDPLAVDVSLQPSVAPDRIDSRAVGPFLLSAAERADLHTRAEQELACARLADPAARLVTTPSGRPYVSADVGARQACDRLGVESTGRAPGDEAVLDLTPTETAALLDLNRLQITCLENEQDDSSKVRLTASGALRAAAQTGDPAVFARCLGESRHTQLTPFVAPPALLFIGPSASAAPTAVGLPAAGVARILLAAAVVLALTVGVGFFLASRVLKPLHTLTVAARRMRDGDRTARADVRARWEVADLARAFNDMAEHVARTEQQRTDLVSDVSHELRTPIGTLRGWLIATQDGIADLNPALVGSLLEETEVLRHLVDDLHDLALADAGELRIDAEPVDAGDVLTQVAAAHPSVLVDVEGDLSLLADRLRLRQLIDNLVTNAIRHSPAGAAILLRGRRDGGRVVLEVVDGGSGIAPEDLPHVFDRFWRADKSRSRTTGGSGLGLAIVRHLTEAHHGTVTAASMPGEGTTFSVVLPAHG